MGTGGGVVVGCVSCQVPWDYYMFFSILASWRMLKSKELVFLQSWQGSKTCERI